VDLGRSVCVHTHRFILKLVSNSPFIPYVGVSRSLNFRSFPVEFSPYRPHLEESFDTPISPEIVKWFKPKSLEDCPTLGFPTPPPPVIVDVSK
jgi:hypothetical protein